jgi:hypothetical protein
MSRVVLRNPALVVAFAALFVALGSTAVAGKLIRGNQIARNAIATKHIGEGQVRTSDLAVDAVTSMEIADESVQVEDLTTDLTATINQAASRPLTPGPPGPVSLANFTIAQGSAYLCSGTLECSIDVAEARCPAGTKPFGGGVATSALHGTFIGTITTQGTYIVAGDNFGAIAGAELHAFAYCSRDVQSITFPNGAMGRTSSDSVEQLAGRRYTAHKK